MSEQTSSPDPALAGAGLSATGTTADEMSPGDGIGATYGDPGGTGTAEEEVVQGDPQADVGQPVDDAEK